MQHRKHTPASYIHDISQNSTETVQNDIVHIKSAKRTEKLEDFVVWPGLSVKVVCMAIGVVLVINGISRLMNSGRPHFRFRTIGNKTPKGTKARIFPARFSKLFNLSAYLIYIFGAIESGKIGAAGLDVVENEFGLYYYDHKSDILDNRELILQPKPDRFRITVLPILPVPMTPTVRSFNSLP